MRTGKRRVKSGRFYDRFFDRAKGKNITVKKEATLQDTMKWIKVVVNHFKDQSKKITGHLKAATVRESCFNIWKFCFEHFQYEKDKKRTEQIRTPNRSWFDRHHHKGIDCDCFSTLIGTMLVQLKIPFVFRLTRYEAAEFEHIYPVAFDENGDEIIIDCVVHEFDYEVPYTEKKDEEMDLQILNGTPASFENDLPIDAQDLFLNEDLELEGLDGKAEREARRAKRKKKRETPLKERIRNGISKINKVNPAAILLRTGILASMKLNLFKVASQLRFAYWSDSHAAKNGVDLARFQQLKRIRQKIEQIFYRAGGKAENLTKAILQGRGNRNKMVALNGLGTVSTYPTDYDDLKTILGEDIYFDELDETDGLDGLGAVAAGAAVVSASGAMGVIAGLLKKIGNIFKKGTKAAKQFQAQDVLDDAEEKTRRFSLKKIANKVRSKIQERRARKNRESSEENNEVITFDNDEEFDVPEQEYEIIPEDEYFPPATDQSQQPDGFEDDPIDTTEKTPNPVVAWIKENQGLSWAIGGVTVAGLGFLGYRAIKGKKTKKKSSGAVNGISKSRKSGTRKKKNTRTTSTKRSSSTRKKTSTAKKPRTSRAKKSQTPRRMRLSS